ncbi:hypothetical protein [Deinococcus frigens]|uniref:hypothetical protein n=1 Tax=Deinococcus frigens TaxID=249403 RepID=UPI000494F90E|nr:hypothetical protein [Deinococcus frigens]
MTNPNTPPHVNHPDFTHQGKRYTLGHLNGFDHTYTSVDPKTSASASYAVRVLFDDHCYTKGVALGEPYDPALFISQTVREVRVFDPQRYQLSLLLPALVKDLLNRQCYFGEQENFVTVDLSTGEKYNVYFSLSKTGKRAGLRLRVQSAYLREQQDKLQKVRFGLLLRNAQHNITTRPPR